jgi:hypothetical protein
MFLQIDERHTPLTALHLLFLTLPIIWAQVAVNVFCEIQNGGPLKLKKDVQRHNTRAIPVV